MNINVFKGIWYRTILLLIILSVLLLSMPMTSWAEDARQKTVSVSSKRFMTDTINAENAYLSLNSNATVTLTIKGSSPTVSMKTVISESNNKSNALRIVIKNDSVCNSMKIDYTYKNSAQVSEAVSLEEQRIKPLSEAVEYIVHIPSVDTMTSLSLCFSGASAGEIEIISVGIVSVFQDDREYFGRLVENSYDANERSAVFAGSVSYEMNTAHPNAKVVLYRLAQTEIIEDVRFVHPYVASCPMTLTYRFEFDIESTSEYCSRYFAAILTENNEIIPLTAETYLKEKNDGRYEVGSGEALDVGFKGIETDLYAGAAENGTAVAFVDVRLDKMGNESGDGYQYALDTGKEYYFDRTYISKLDEEIKSLSEAGASIYLRFLLDSPSPLFGHSEKNVISNKTKYFAIDPQNDETVDNIFAYADFISSRYSEMAKESFRGIVLGRSLDKALEYNYCGSVAMSTYADMLAKTYSIIRIALNRSGDDLEMIIPLSDDKIGADVIVTSAARGSDYPADILADSFLKSLKRYGSDVSSMYFMLESDGIPDIWTSHSALLNKMTANDCSAFINMMKKLSAQNEGLSDEIMFCWFPSAALSAYELLNVYAFNYNALACTNGVRSYIVSLVERKEQIDVGGSWNTVEEYAFSTLKSTYKYIDTDNNERVCTPALEATGKSDWNEIIEGYSVDKIVKRDLLEKDASYSLPAETIGSYTMWDFSVANGTGGWSGSDGCKSLSVYTPAESVSRALISTLGFGAESGYGADYGSIVYRSSETLIMKDISSVSFEIFVPQGKHGDVFEVRVTVGAGDSVIESSGIIKTGEAVTIYADISELDQVEYIKIGIRDLGGVPSSDVDMYISHISIHSQKYNDSDLENMVLSGKMLEKEDYTENTDDGGYFAVGVILSISLLLVAMAWVWVSVINKREV